LISCRALVTASAKDRNLVDEAVTRASLSEVVGD
jgi:hypothetical protein